VNKTREKNECFDEGRVVNSSRGYSEVKVHFKVATEFTISIYPVISVGVVLKE
jgi:nitrate reductase NapE component